MGINWNPLSWGDELAGAGKFVGKTIYESTPLDNALKAAQAAREGDWGRFTKELAMGGVDALALGLGGGAALRAAGGLGKLGAKDAARAFIKGSFSPGKIPTSAFAGATRKPILGTLGKALAAVKGPVGPLGAAGIGGLGLLASKVSGGEQPATQVPGSTGTIPDIIVDHFGGPKAPWQQNFSETLAQTTAPAGAGAPAAGRAGLVGLTPGQIEELAMQERALQREYDDLMNQFVLQERQGRQGEAGARTAARREAAGSAQDLATQLASAGLDISPAAAISAEENVARTRQAQEAPAIQALTQLLAEIESGKTTAKSQLKKGKTAVQKARKQAQIENTLAEQAALYNMIGGM